MKKLTMDDIASLAGVSKATVSRSINSPHLVRTDTREHVLKTMKSHKYVYDAFAADFSRKKTSVIGLVVPTIRSSIYAKSSQGVQDMAHEMGFSVIIGNSNYDSRSEIELLRLFQRRRVAGIILCGITARHKEMLDVIGDIGIPCVVTWEIVENSTISYVGFDNLRGVYSATNYLIGLGHRRVGLIIGPFSRIDRVKQRLKGYRTALKEGGIIYNDSIVIEKEITLVDGKEAMQRLLSLPKQKRPTAVIALSDVLAMGAMAAIREKGMSVPHDISLVGFDDIDFAAYTDPPLTTVRVPSYEMGWMAVRTLVDDMIKKDLLTGPQFCLDTELVVRKSCQEFKG